MSFSQSMKKLAAGVVASSAIAYSGAVMAADTIKVGVLHSLSGTMAISETTLKDTVLMLIEQPLHLSLVPGAGNLNRSGYDHASISSSRGLSCSRTCSSG